MNISRIIWDGYALFRIISHRFLNEGLDVACTPYAKIPGNINGTFGRQKELAPCLSKIWEFTIPSESFYSAPNLSCCQVEYGSRRRKGRWSINNNLDISSQIFIFEQDSKQVISKGHPYEQSEFIATLARYFIGNPEITSIPENKVRVLKMINDLSQGLSSRCEYRYYSFNNHLLNNLRALTWSNYINAKDQEFEKTCGLYFHYLEVLLDDTGWLKEGSSSYHCLVTVWTLEMAHLLCFESRQRYKKLIRNMLAHCDNFTINNTHLVRKGDICPDMTTGMVLRDLSLLRQDVFEASNTRPLKSISYSSEYLSIVHQDKQVICSILPSDRGQRPHHGHMDSRHIDFVKHGQLVIVNSGRHCYSSACDHQVFQRSTASHNGLVLKNRFLPRLRRAGYWMYSFLSGESEAKILSDKTLIINEKGLGLDKLGLSRQIMFTSDGNLEITDTIEKLSARTVEANLFYIFDTSIELNRSSDHSISYKSSNCSGEIDIFGDVQDISIDGKTVVSKDYGDLEEASVLKIVMQPSFHKSVKLVIR